MCYTKIPKNPGILFSKIPVSGFKSDPGIPGFFGIPLDTALKPYFLLQHFSSKISTSLFSSLATVTVKKFGFCRTQCPAGSRKIPGSRDWTSIPIPGLLKIQSRDFSGFWYSTEDNVYKDFYTFSDSLWVFFVLPELFKVLKIFALQALTDFLMKSKGRFQLLTF